MARLRFLLVFGLLLTGLAGLSLMRVSAQEPPTTAAPDVETWLSTNPNPVIVDAGGEYAPPRESVNRGLAVYTDRIAFVGDYPSLPFEDFETDACDSASFPAPLSSRLAITNTLCYHVGQIRNGVEFRDNPLNAGTGGEATNGIYAIDGGTNGLTTDGVVANTYTNTFQIYFTPSVTTVGMDLISVFSATPLRVRAFDDDDDLLYDTTLPAVGASGTFLGLDSLIGIARVELFANNGAPGDGAEGLEGIYFGSPGGEITLETTVGTDPHTCATTDEVTVSSGTAVTYCYRVTNNSAITYSTHTLSDTLLGEVLGDEFYELAPGTSLAITDSIVPMNTTVSTATWEVMIPLEYAPFIGSFTDIDLAIGGAPLNLEDDGEANVTLPFVFDFYDVKTTQMRVGNNGAVVFNVVSGEIFHGNSPLAYPFMKRGAAVFWDDLDASTGEVYAGTYTTRIDEENDILTPAGAQSEGGLTYYAVQWKQRSHYPGPSPTPITVTALFLAPGQGLEGYIVYTYNNIVFGNPDYDYGASATIGLNLDSTTATQFSYNTARPDLNGRAIGFLPTNSNTIHSDTDTVTVNVEGMSGNKIYLPITRRK